MLVIRNIGTARKPSEKYKTYYKHCRGRRPRRPENISMWVVEDADPYNICKKFSKINFNFMEANMQRILSYIRKAVDDYNMIENNDKIAVRAFWR